MEAEKLEKQVLEMRTRILGEEDPHTLESMDNLASTYQYLGKYMEAEKLQKQVLEIESEFLAKKLQKQVLEMRTRILGEEHLHTLESMANLANTYRNLGKNMEQRSYKASAGNKNRILGEEHPHTL
ncbi:hypothetical protein BDQ17DRAFT_1432799 [Cyathus striatus]|nr:hypothetical protein BDQ17DRAFT_1432799 [Cyathus striatus]